MVKVKAVGKFLAAGSLAFVLLLQGCTTVESTTSEPETDSTEALPAFRFNPQPSPAFNESWPTNVTRQELVDTVLLRSFEFLDNSAVDSCSVKTDIFIVPDTLTGHVEMINTLSSKMNLVFCDYLESDMTLVAGDYNYLKEIVKLEGLPSDEFDGICGYELDPSNYAKTGCAAKGVAWVGVPFGTELRGKLVSDSNAVAMVSHELFHIVQDSIDPSQNLYRPVWWIEGGGEFIGRLMPRYLEFQDYGSVPLPRDSYGTPPLLEPFSNLSAYEIWEPDTVGSNGYYYAGQIALEYIVANSGMEAVIDLLVRLGEGKEFNSAFEEVLGISVPDFYGKFALLHDHIISQESG